MSEEQDAVSALHKRFTDVANTEMYNEYQKLKQNTREQWSNFIYGSAGYKIEELKPLEILVEKERQKIIDRRVNKKYEDIVSKIKDFKWLWENQP